MQRMGRSRFGSSGEAISLSLMPIFCCYFLQIEGLLGALGGLFGLYVGFSVITMAEAAVFIAKLIKIILCIGPKCKSEVRPTA